MFKWRDLWSHSSAQSAHPPPIQWLGRGIPCAGFDKKPASGGGVMGIGRETELVSARLSIPEMFFLKADHGFGSLMGLMFETNIPSCFRKSMRKNILIENLQRAM